VDAPLTPDPTRLTKRQRRDLRRRAFGTRLLTTFAALLSLATLVVFGVVGVFMRHTGQTVLEAEVTEHLESVAQLTAGRLAEHAGLLRRARHSDQVVRRLSRRQLAELCRTVRAESRVAEVVVFDPGPSPAELEILGASSVDEAALLGRLLADANLSIAEAVTERRPASSAIWRDQLPGTEDWQHFKSAYAPVQDPDGRLLGVVGVELPTGFAAALGRVDRAFLFLGGIAGLTVLLAAVFLVRQRVHVPVYRLVRAMEGEEGPALARVRHDDEIGRLTEHYNHMVERLREKDATLQELYEQARETATYLESYTNSLVAGVPEGVVAVDPEGKLTVWNARAQAILRETRPLGEPLTGDGPVAAALRSALDGSKTAQALFVVEVAGGEEEAEEDLQRLVELTCAPFRDEGGELLGAVALLSDRTELERFRRAASRNERLEAVGSLGGGLAHEIKNPLGAISGFAELIERKADPDLARLTARLREQVVELNEFLNEFLVFARDERIRREPTDLAALLRGSVHQALIEQGADDEVAQAALAGDPVELAGSSLRVRLELADLPQLALDRVVMRSAFVNLVRNALQAMTEGGELRVVSHKVGQGIYVRVRDQGPGIPLNLRERVFDPLFTTRAEGTGLGLAICHKVVTAHGGKLSVRDGPQGGAEVVVRLPLVVTSAPAAKAPASTQAATTGQTGR
jgi:signal transduction histidine kinase